MTEPAATAPDPSNAGSIALHLQGNKATTNVMSPRVSVNGHAVTTSYGTTTISMPPGHHRIEIHSQWLRKFGQAALDVDVATGQTVDVYYATPWHQFTTGSIGFERQKRKGAAFFFVLIAIAGIVGAVVGVLIGL